MDTKKIKKFLKSVDGAELIYLRYSMTIRQNLESLINEFQLNKMDVCTRFKVKPTQYYNFVRGNFNYTIEDLARINSAFIELETKKITENKPFQ